MTEGRAPQKDELIHIAVSFRDGDFQALGGNETIRQHSLREATREAVTRIADELRADELRWVAGIHRNTDHPHIHLLIHRAYLDRETRAEQRLARIPEEMLAARVRDENGMEKVRPGSFGQAFETALDRAQERAREDAGKEKATTSDERLLEAAHANPSLAGRELMQEIILRGPAREPDERPETTDLRAAFRTLSLDDPDYRSQPEQADWLGQRSQDLRDLFERGAMVRGDVLRRDLERPRGLDAAERHQSIESNSHSAPDLDQIFSTNGHSAAKDLRLSNGGHFDSDRNSTVDGPPDERDRQLWPIDSSRKWHFDSLRDLAEPMPVPVADWGY